VALTTGAAFHYSRPGGGPSAEDEEFMLVPFERDTPPAVFTGFIVVRSAVEGLGFCSTIELAKRSF
jgi:hypothetical protein